MDGKEKIELNEEETECLIIGTKHDTTKYDDLKEVSINNRGIILSGSVRDLGFVIDSNLTCNEQIQTVIKNANFSLRNIAFIKKYLDVDSMKKLVHNYIITRLDYCNSLYHKHTGVPVEKNYSWCLIGLQDLLRELLQEKELPQYLFTFTGCQ